MLAAVSLLASVMCLSLGTYVLYKNRYMRSSRAFFVLTSLAALTTLCDFFLITAPDGNAAQIFARAVILLSTLLSAAMLSMTSYLPYERGSALLVRHRRGFVALSAAAAVTLAALDVGAVEDRWGWWILLNQASLIWYVTIVLTFITGTILLVRIFLRESRRESRHRVAPMALGMAVPAITALVVVATVTNDSVDPPLLSIITLVTSLCVGYGVVRQRLFILEPVKEDVQSYSKAPAIRPGQAVLVEAKQGDLAYQMFIRELADGGQGLIITRIHPRMVRERYGLKNTPIAWLTEKTGPDSISPVNVGLLQHTAVGVLHRSGGPTVLLDGLEYLGSYNRPEAILKLIYALKDAVSMNGSKLIVAVDPNTMAQWDLSRLEREMELLRNG